MNTAATLRIESHPLPTNFAFPDLPAGDKRETIAVLHPDSSLPYTGSFIRTDEPFTEAEIVEILHGHPHGKGRRLYVFGQVDYVDIFGKRHWTRFCACFNGRPNLVTAAENKEWGRIATALNNSAEGGFGLANQHNCTDDDQND
jgi:hypothetical protein